jgi:hypothetical protein
MRIECRGQTCPACVCVWMEKVICIGNVDGPWGQGDPAFKLDSNLIVSPSAVVTFRVVCAREEARRERGPVLGIWEKRMTN